MTIKIARRGAVLRERCRNWAVRNFSGTEGALYHTLLALSAPLLGWMLSALVWPGALGTCVFSVAALAVEELAGWLLGKLLRRLVGHDLRGLMALALFTGVLATTVANGSGEDWTYRVWLVTGVVTLAVSLTAAAFWSLAVRRRVTPTTVSVLLLSGAVTVLAGVFLFSDGFGDDSLRHYTVLLDAPDAAESALESALGPGPYAVETLDYGPGGELEAGTVNLTSYMSRDTDDFLGSYVDAYLDYELDRVPLVGRVWYPAEGKNCPLLVMAHGNHEITTDSYLGYAYLGEYLASHGYVVASVDQNACNLLTNENDGRAVLLLEHIGLLLDWNDREGNPLYSRLDRENIAIAGHSRGGEMAATAYLFNGYDRYPENGAVRFDYHYNIKSVIAIAPTVNQYKPADHSVALTDVNYLLLHGAADRDVTRFMGMSQYENISFTGDGDYLKSALYIAGANHGQFNSLWGAYDQTGPFGRLLNVRGLLPEEEQQRIAQVFIKVFLDVTLRGDDTCRSLLTDWDRYAAQLPETVYVQSFEESGFTPIADFEEDSDLETGTMVGVTAAAVGVNWWTEEVLDYAGNTAYDTHALRLRWGGTGTYTLRTPPLDLTGQRLTFDICDRDTRAVERGEYALVDGEVILTDGAGREASASIRDHAAVFPILAVRADKLDFLFGTVSYKYAPATVSIPVENFAGDSDFDPAAVTAVRFRFEGGGQVNMDNIGFTPMREGSGTYA